MLCLATGVNPSAYSATTPASTGFAEREDAARAASREIVLARSRLLARPFWQFLLNTWWDCYRVNFSMGADRDLAGVEPPLDAVANLAGHQ
jgi:hypothetical protein